ncbi:MAG: insulinase family protein [Alphaproteobacteria bacterium]|nr:insulinase family protein [Alphaproteobacteria bacterium]
MESQISTLANGLRIVTASRPHTESVTLGIWVNTGSACEKEEINGISHFLEHMVFKGTEKRSSLQISEEFEDVGGQSNAYTSREFTAFYAKMLKQDVELAIDILADIVLHSNFPQEELEKEREVVVQEIKQAIDTPDDIIFDYLQEQAFQNQALGRSILGPAEKVRSYTGTTLSQYRQSNYAAKNTVVCAVGNVNHDAFVKMVETRMSDMQSTPHFAIDKQIYTGGFYQEKRDIEQAHVVLGFEGEAYSQKNYYPTIVFSTILGGGMSSRLFQEIREKRGLVYSVYSFSNSHTQSGLFGIYAGTTREELKQLMPVVCEEIRKIRTDLVTDKELQRAKTQLKASMLMALESSSSTVEVLARQMLIFGRPIPVKEMVEKIDAITREDIRDIANKIFSTHPTYALVGDIDGYPAYDKIKNLIRI